MELRNILKDITIDDLTAANLKSVGGPVYADVKAKDDLQDLELIQNAWRLVHAPAYGQFIPQSGTFAEFSIDAPQAILQPTGSEVIQLDRMTITNASGSSAIFSIYLVDSASPSSYNNVYIANDMSIPDGVTMTMLQDVLREYAPIMIDANAEMRMSSTQGLDVTIFSFKVVQ